MTNEIKKRLQYLVTLREGQWKVKLDKYYGPYPDKNAAISNAVDAAQRAGKKGQDAEVLIGQEGEMNLLWTFGDAYPYVKAEDE